MQFGVVNEVVIVELSQNIHRLCCPPRRTAGPSCRYKIRSTANTRPLSVLSIMKGGRARAGNDVTGEGEEIHFWIRWITPTWSLHESACDHVPRCRPIQPERVIKRSGVDIAARAVPVPAAPNPDPRYCWL